MVIKGNQMKTIAIILALTAGTATAADLSIMDQAVSMGAATDINYTTGTQDWEWTATPYAGININGINLLAETGIDMLKLDEGNIFTGIDFSMEYVVPNTNVNLYTEVSSDKDFKFGDVTLGTKIKF
tara:strand:- start:383 stop:763 length:381 start_codon:yes stop_codon:yes gene_type:complete